MFNLGYKNVRIIRFGSIIKNKATQHRAMLSLVKYVEMWLQTVL